MQNSKAKLIENIKVSEATSECWDHLIKSINRAAKNYAFGGKTKTVKGNFVIAMDQRTIEECEELSSEAIAACINYSTKKDGLTIGNLIGYGVKAVQNKLIKYWLEKKKRNFVQLSLDIETDIQLDEASVIQQTDAIFNVINEIMESEDIDSEYACILTLLALGDDKGGLAKEPKSTRHDKLKKAREYFYSIYYRELINEESDMMVKLQEAKAKRVDEEVALTDFISQLYRYAKVIETPAQEVIEYTPTEDDYRASLATLSTSALDKVIEQRPELIKFVD